MYTLKERKLSGEVKYTIHNEIKLALIGGEKDFDLLNYIFAKVHINPNGFQITSIKFSGK